MGNPPGYLHWSTWAQFWRDFLALTATVRRILPLWVYQSPTRLIQGFCSRDVPTALLQRPVWLSGAAAPSMVPEGTFILRLSDNQVGHIPVAFVGPNAAISHTLVEVKGCAAHCARTGTCADVRLARAAGTRSPIDSLHSLCALL
jgi:hypothetical protein